MNNEQKFRISWHEGLMPLPVSRYRQTGNTTVVFEAKDRTTDEWIIISVGYNIPPDIMFVLTGQYTEYAEIKPSAWQKLKKALQL